MALLRKITLGIREQLTYSRRYERGVQTPAETLAKATGTCRDYAFLMIEGVRSLGLAARFVSGYIFVPGAGDGPVNGGGSRMPGCRSTCRVPAGSISIRPTASSATGT